MGVLNYNHNNPVHKIRRWLLLFGVVAFGIWLTLGFCLYGGIVAVITAAHGGWPAGATAFGILRILATGPSFWATFLAGYWCWMEAYFKS